MAMPRPSGEAQEIAEKVVPGLYKSKRSKRAPVDDDPRGSMSEVEIMQTNQIESKEGLR